MKNLPALFVLLTLVACSSLTNKDDMHRHRAVQEHASLHGVNSELLRASMARLGELLNSSSQRDKNRQKYLDNLVQTAAEVVISAEILTRHVPLAELSSEHRILFANLAEQLYEQANDVATLAQDQDVKELDAAYQHMEMTCFKCHRLFREL